MPGSLAKSSRRRPARTTLLASGLLTGALLLPGCGTGQHAPSLKGLPLIPGTRVVAKHRSCDRGSNAYCVLELVVVGNGYRSSKDMLHAERRFLKRHRWVRVDAPVGPEIAADSPGNGLRVTYATAAEELEAVDLGWIKRPRPIALALSREIFNHSSALSVLLQLGTT